MRTTILLEQFDGTSLSRETAYITVVFKASEQPANAAVGLHTNGGTDFLEGRSDAEPRPVIDHVVQALALFWGKADHGRTKSIAVGVAALP